MIYIPILKTRAIEMKVAKDLNQYFSDNMIPLFEIINDYYEIKYKIDPLTQEFIYDHSGKRRKKIKEIPTEDDIITLNKLNNIVNNKTAMIDYFRYSLKKYGNQIDIQKVSLSYRLNDDLELYKNRMKEVATYQNFIPVISIKKGFVMPKNELTNFLTELKNLNDSVALRITEEYLNDYQEILEEVLEDKDYLLFDIEEQCPEVKFMELEEINEMNIKAQIILINSPRKAGIKNGDYPENDYTDLIDNSAKDKVSEYSFTGYGDYCGYKDTLPSTRGGNNTGAAIALIFDFNNNAFWTYTNKDTSQGMRGYKNLLPQIINDKTKFDSEDDCEGYKKISQLPGYGNWCSWLEICIRRYISQVYKYMN